MNDHLITSIVTVSLGVIGVAAIAVLVSRSANTAQVVKTGGGAFQQMLCTAISPVTGGAGGIGSAGGFLPGAGSIANALGCGNLVPDVSSTITFGGV